MDKDKMIQEIMDEPRKSFLKMLATLIVEELESAESNSMKRLQTNGKIVFSCTSVPNEKIDVVVETFN